jgi:16S rRNA processing protein RimM
MKTPTMFQIGKIIGSHGLRGEVKVFPLTDFPERFEKKVPILARHESGRELMLHPVSARFHKGMIILKVEEFDEINQTIPWLKSELLIPETDLMPLPEGRYYIHQIIGLEVFLEDGSHVGTVTDVLQPGANDVYVVRLSESGQKLPLESKEEVLLPVIDDVILMTDTINKRLIVRLLAGL